MRYETTLIEDSNINVLRSKVSLYKEDGWVEDGLWYTDHFKCKQPMKRITEHNKDIWEL